MADEAYSTIFSNDPRTGALSYPQLEARRRIAIALATRNRPYPKTIGEGLTALGEGLGEGYMNSGLERAERAQQGRDTAATSLLMGGAPPVAAAPGRVSEAAPEEVAQPAVATADAQPSMPIEEWKQRVARNESGGQRDPYSALGELSRRGDRAYGKYQVMGENVPKWTKQFVGREMTPEEFLADKDAQETVATGMGGKYLAKYGPDGAARAWFAGEKGMNDPNRKDTLGTHVAEYSRRFNIPLVSREQVVASAAKQPNAFAAAPEMSPEAAGAMAYAPEGAAAEGAEGLGAGMLANLTNPQSPGLGLRGPSDSTFPAPAAPPVSRDSIAASVAAQNGVVPPQQVAQGPAPIPQAQPALPPGTPTVTPQSVPKAPEQSAQPVDPGPEPKLQTFLEGNPQIKQQMQNARRIALDPSYSPQIQAQAQAAYQELEKRANDAYTKQWTVWHGRQQIQEKFKLEEEDKNLQTAKLRGETEDAAEKRVLVQRLGGQDPQKFFDNLGKEQTLAEVAGKVRDDNRTILKAVNDGVIMGWGSGLRINAAKLASFAFNNGYASEQAANTEIMRALGGSRIRESLSQINPTGATSNTDTALARQLSGADPAMEPKSFMALLHKSSEGNAKLINEYEDKKDYYLGGTRAERQFDIAHPRTAPPAATDAMLANRDDKALRAKYDDTYGEGSSALEIERFKRRQRRGG
jgi:hypothetical protein